MTTLLSHGGPDVNLTDAPDPELGVATVNGVVFARRADDGWPITHRALQGKHISALMRERGGTIFAGTHKSGLWASADGGRTWEERGNGLASGDIYAMNWCVKDGKARLFVGTEPAHLYVSDDLGATWIELPGLMAAATTSRWTFPAPPHIAHVKNINFDPRSADSVYVGVEQGGLYKSLDGGRTFRELAGFDDDVHRTVVSGLEPEHVYISTGIGLYHSTDAGEKWEQLTTVRDRIGYPDALIAHPAQRGHFYTAGARTGPGSWPKTNDADARIARSHDGGRTWQMLERGLPDHIQGNFEAMVMNAWRGGFALFAGTTDGEVYHSEDEGESWRAVITDVAPVSKAEHYVPLQSGAPELAAAR